MRKFLFVLLLLAGTANAITYQFEGLTNGNVDGSSCFVDLLGSGNNLCIDDNTGGTDTIAWNIGGFARINYAAAGTIRLLWNYTDTTQKTGYVKVDFRYSATGKTAKGVKVFGLGYPTTYSNSTFPFNAGAIGEVLYGDSLNGGDVDQEYWYDGTYHGTPPTPPASPWRAAPTFTTTSSWNNDTNWHTMEVWFKFNDTGTLCVGPTQNGEYEIAVDGVVKLHMTNVFNAGCIVSPYQDLSRRFQISFGDFSGQGGWTLDIRNLFISYDNSIGVGGVTITPAAAALTFTGSSASLAISNNKTFIPGAAAINFTGSPAQIMISGNPQIPAKFLLHRRRRFGEYKPANDPHYMRVSAIYQ